MLVDLYDRAMTAIRSVEGQEPHEMMVERIQNACDFKGAPSAVGLAQMKAWGRWVQSDRLHTPWCDHPPDPTGRGAHPLCGSSGMPCPMFKAGTPFDAAQGSLSSLDSAAPEPRWMVNPGYRDLFARFGTPPTAPSPGSARARSEVCARPGEGRLTVIVCKDGNGAEVL